MIFSKDITFDFQDTPQWCSGSRIVFDYGTSCRQSLAAQTIYGESMVNSAWNDTSVDRHLHCFSERAL